MLTFTTDYQGEKKMFWRKRKKSKQPVVPMQMEPAQTESYRIDYDMMLKGNVCRRNHGKVRQIGVTVNGATRLVTSGDEVDRPTYEALLQCGALREDYYGVLEPEHTDITHVDFQRRAAS